MTVGAVAMLLAVVSGILGVASDSAPLKTMATVCLATTVLAALSPLILFGVVGLVEAVRGQR